jgi:effector-binding domain-containing protein
VVNSVDLAQLSSTTAPCQLIENDMHITSVELSARPMLYLSKTTTRAEIPSVLNAGFAELAQFMQKLGIPPAGPRLAVYHDWSGDKMAVDIGFPVSAADAQKAESDILAGMTPDGFALKVVHVGPYADLPATYDAIGAAMSKAGIAEANRMWEVYVGEPGVTPDAELITEIYMQVTPAQAANYPAT